jgi:glutathione synthase/RimK-type ligase-like ATP-grasp enzyme
MSKLLILVDKIGEKKELFAEFIAKNLPNDEIAIARFTDLVFDIDGTNLKVIIDELEKEITEFDLVYIRRAGNKFSIPAANLAICLTHLKVKFFDTTFQNIGPLGNKLTSYLKLSSAGLPTIPSFFCHSSKINNYKKQIVEKLGLPLVAKELSAHRGIGVLLIKNEEDFSKLPQIGPHGGATEYFFQKFYESNEEYRILTLKDKIGAFERKIRTDPNEFRSNVAIGAREEFIDINKIPENIKEISIKAAKALNIEIAGVDIMIDKDKKAWLLEVNRGPGLTYDTKISPELPNLAKFFKEELKNG